MDRTTGPSARHTGGKLGIYGLLYSVVWLLILWPRLGMLSHGLWQDEITSVTSFLSQGPEQIIFGDHTLNNHVLFSLLSWTATWVAGDSETVYRLPSLLPGLAAIVVLAVWVHRRQGAAAGLLTTLLLAASPWHTALVPQARGYGLAYLWIALMIVIGDRLSRQVDIGTLVGFGVVGFLSAMTLPVLAIPFAAVTLGLLVAWRRDRRAMLSVLAAGAAAGIAVVVGSLPFLTSVVRGSQRVQAGDPLEWHATATFWLEIDLSPAVRTLLLGWRDTFDAGRARFGGAGLLVLGPVAAALIAAALRGANTQQRSLVTVAFIPFVVSYVVLTVLGVSAPYRFVSYLFMFVAPLLAIGLVTLVRLALPKDSSGGRTLAEGTVAVVVTLLGLMGLAKHGAYFLNTPMEASKDVAAIVNQTDAMPVMSNSVRPRVLEYYLDMPMELIDNEEVEGLVCAREGPLIFIDHPYNIGSPDTACLEERQLGRFHFPQRRGRLMDVWILDGAPSG